MRRLLLICLLVLCLGAESKDAVTPEATPEATPDEKAEATPAQPQLRVTAPSANWIRVDQPETSDGNTITMMLHARGQARMWVRKSSPKRARSETVEWLRRDTRDLEVFDIESTGGGLKREEFSFEGWQGRKPVAGLAGVFVVGDDAYVIVATCDKAFFEKHESELHRVLAEFRTE